MGSLGSQAERASNDPAPTPEPDPGNAGVGRSSLFFSPPRTLGWCFFKEGL